MLRRAHDERRGKRTEAAVTFKVTHYRPLPFLELTRYSVKAAMVRLWKQPLPRLRVLDEDRADRQLSAASRIFSTVSAAGSTASDWRLSLSRNTFGAIVSHM